jgi:aminoglycoside phosphotransferase (APT) family kinase protein
MTAGAAEPATMAGRIAEYLRRQMPDAARLSIRGLYRIPGGASRETWSFDAAWQDGDGTAQQRGFILRRDPEAGLLETDRDIEYRVYRAFQGSAVPVPRMYWLETGSGSLDRPFFIMERIDGCQTDPNVLALRPDGPGRRQIARRKFEILGAIHAADAGSLGLLDLEEWAAPAAGECAGRALAHWERIIDQQQLEPQPVLRLAIAWLRAHPPAPAQRIVVCHGDFRSGNFLYSDDEIWGVLDWEMVHLGDPLEDLAWTCMKNWRFSNVPGVPGSLFGGIAAPAEAFAVYERASGLRVDREALHWWDVFSHVKAAAIWITGARSFCDGRTTSPFMALIPRLLNATQYGEILNLLGW